MTVNNKLLKWARKAGFDVAHNVNGKDVSTHQTGYVFIVNEENLQAYTALAMKERDEQEERLYKRYEAEAEFQANEVAELKAHIERLLNASRCPNHGCNDTGCILVRSGLSGEKEPKQCDFCFREPDSLFNVMIDAAKAIREVRNED